MKIKTRDLIMSIFIALLINVMCGLFASIFESYPVVVYEIGFSMGWITSYIFLMLNNKM